MKVAMGGVWLFMIIQVVGCTSRWKVIHPTVSRPSPLAHSSFSVGVDCGQASDRPTRPDAVCEIAGVQFRQELRARLGVDAMREPQPAGLHLIAYVLELRMGDFAALSPAPTYLRAHLVWRLGGQIVAVIETEIVIPATNLQPGVRRRLEMAGRQLAAVAADYVSDEQSHE